MDNVKFEKLFPLGSHLCREPMPPMLEMKHDMELLKKQGFNLIKLQEHWMIDEPSEGCYDFSRYEELIEHAAKLDMGVYLGFTCEQAPSWLYRKHPDCRMVGRDGLVIPYQAQTTLPADGKPGPCYDHVGAMADQLRFIRATVTTLGRFENLVVWNTWQEIGYWSEALVGRHVCYCSNTIAHYRCWLKERYKNLDALNRAWNCRYADWEDIIPERLTSNQSWPQCTAWRYFMDNVQISYVLKARAEAIRAADPMKRPVFAHKGGPEIGSGRDWSYARCQDFLGSSSYPAWGCLDSWDDGFIRPFVKHVALHGETWNIVAMRFDYIRCANPPGKPVWAAEFQGGPVSTGFHLGRVPSPEDIRRWMLTAIGSGVTAISFWITRAEIMAAELNGFSLLNSAGDTTLRLAEAGRIGRALNQYPELFAKATYPRAEVAILVNEWSYQVCAGLQGSAGHGTYSLRGWYRRLWEAGIPVDFLEVSELDEKYALDYKTIIMPFPIVLSAATAKKISAMVRQGVNLVCEAMPGRVDENGSCPRGEMSPVMAELFGVRHGEYKLVREPDGGIRWSVAERTWGEFMEATMLQGVGPLSGHALRANVYVQTFTPAGGVPVLRCGEAVGGVCRKVGKGTAWLLGTFAGHGGTAYRDAESQSCALKILAECGIKSDACGKLLRRRRVADGKEAWLFTNPTDQPVTEFVDLGAWSHVEDLLGETLVCENRKVQLTVDSLDVRVLVLS